MAVDLSYSDHVRDLIARTEQFIRDEVLPVEDAHGGDITAAGGDAIRADLQKAAKLPVSSLRTRPSNTAATA